MTTAVYRDGILAMDSRAYAGDKHPIGTKNKIKRLADGSLLAVSSRLTGQPESFARWCESKKQPHLAELEGDKTYGVQALLIRTDGSVYYWNDGSCFSGPLEAPYFAIGSGEEYAMGALMMGATAEEAVSIACRSDVWSDFPVVSVAR